MSPPISRSRGRSNINRPAFAVLIAIGILLMSILECGGRPVPCFRGDSAYVFLEEQCDIGPRYPGSPGHREVQRYIVSRLEDFGANVSLQPFDGVLTTGDTLHLVNIIGNYNMKAKRRILLGAHYDTRPRAERDPEPANRPFPILGANDGASGVAVLLELARILGRSEPPLGIDLVFFDGEDYGREGATADYILGSTHFARAMKGYRPSAVIIVDMVGERDAEILVEGFSKAYSPLLVEAIFDAAEFLHVGAFVRKEGTALIDDHLPFIETGVPSIVLIDFEYPFWHTLGDTPDKCSPRSLEQVGIVLVHYIWHLE
jgi:glutaminyl-peptide cyclotransferase